MTASLVGIREKIKRADQHINQVAKTVRSFRDKCDCAVVHHYDVDTQRHTYKLKVANRPRISLRRVSIISGEAIHQLRSVLDHLLEMRPRLR